MLITHRLLSLVENSGFANLTFGNVVMLGVGGLLLWFAIYKKWEPLLLLPIGAGCLLVNLPLGGLMGHEGFLHYLLFGTQHEIYPILIFMGVGAMTDFGPLLANPLTFILGAAAQLGVFVALVGAVLIGFTIKEGSAIGIIGGADGPTSIYLAVKMAPQILGPIAVAAYTYMSLVPLIQPPVIKLLTTKRQRKIRMLQLRPVSRLERIMFPIIAAGVTGLILPASIPLIGVLMLGNLMRESGVVNRLSNTAQNELINIVTIFLGLTVGGTMDAEHFLTTRTLEIMGLGIVAFIFSTAGGVVFAHILNLFLKHKINPMIGAAGVSAVPMSARVVQRMGQAEDPGNFLLMHAMGPNVAGVIGTATAAGVFLTLLH